MCKEWPRHDQCCCGELHRQAYSVVAVDHARVLQVTPFAVGGLRVELSDNIRSCAVPGALGKSCAVLEHFYSHSGATRMSALLHHTQSNTINMLIHIAIANLTLPSAKSYILQHIY